MNLKLKRLQKKKWVSQKSLNEFEYYIVEF